MSEVHLRKYFPGASAGRPPALCQIATNQQDKIPPLHQSYSPGVDQDMRGLSPTQQEMENISDHEVGSNYNYEEIMCGNKLKKDPQLAQLLWQGRHAFK